MATLQNRDLGSPSLHLVSKSSSLLATKLSSASKLSGTRSTLTLSEKTKTQSLTKSSVSPLVSKPNGGKYSPSAPVEAIRPMSSGLTSSSLQNKKTSLINKTQLVSTTKKPSLSTQSSTTAPSRASSDLVGHGGTATRQPRPQLTTTSLLSTKHSSPLVGGSATRSLATSRGQSLGSMKSGLELSTSTKSDNIMTTSSSKGVSLTGSAFQSSVTSNTTLLQGRTPTTGSSILSNSVITNKHTLSTTPMKHTSSFKPSPIALSSAPKVHSSSSSSSSATTPASNIIVKPQKMKSAVPISKSSLLLKSDATNKLFKSSTITTTTTATDKNKVIKPKQDTFLKQAIVAPTREEGMPEYEFTSTATTATKRELHFVPPELDASVQQNTKATPMDIEKLKVTLINAVGTSLLKSPDFKDRKDPSTKHLTKLGHQVSHHDPEFILKLALYTRNELNIRTTANFLLALAANISYCRPFLKKYYETTINLPSDWIEVAEIYQAFHDKSINFGSLPTALRKVMSTKFKAFDAYQLAKYNKDTSKKKKKKKGKKGNDNKKPGGGNKQPPSPTKPTIPKKTPAKTSKVDSSSSSDSDSDDSDDTLVPSDSESEAEVERLTFTLKQLIRKLHISDPVYHIMCLIGKKYPEDPEAFRRTRLPGIWNQDMAGKRMRLPTPETWETQVSMKGNKAHVWEELIDHKKLPFMAMLRNLRNVLIAGISAKHHQSIIYRLTDENSVINSRQFPFRFFSAYEVLSQLETAQTVAKPMMMGVLKGSNPLKRIKKVKETPSVSPDLIKKYRNALDTALKISTKHNVKPIKGNTVVLCNVGSSVNKPCSSARGLGKPRTILEIGLLMGLMCKYACEECTVALYGSKTYRNVTLQEGTILHNMSTLLSSVNTGDLGTDEGSIPLEYLRTLLIDRIVVDNFVILTDQMNMDSKEGKRLVNFLNKYRNVVNPNLLFVSIDLSSRNVGVSDTITPKHENDIHLAGYSDQMLRFIAERGDSGQLTHVENIDKQYNLTDVKTVALKESATTDPKQDNKLSTGLTIPTVPQKQWRTVRVFISSTFRDMHGERDLLTRYVFPELRKRCRSLFINIYEVDLRWGITEQDARSHKALEICLSEISRCNYFLGLLGGRYGWVPEDYQVPDTSEYDWVKEYPSGRSITELEMYHAALCEPDKAVGKAFFYIRDQSATEYVPDEFQKEFKSESHAHDQKLNALKTRILSTGLETYNGYRGQWLGNIQGKPLLHQLEDFGKRVLYNLWNAIQKDFPVTDEVEDPLKKASRMNQAFFETQINNFIGRHSLLSLAQDKLENIESGMLLATGKSGSGKSAFMAALAQHLSQVSNYTVITHFIGATPGSTDISNILTRICHEVNQLFALSEQLPEDYLDLVKQWPEFLAKALDAMNNEDSKLIVIIDGIDLLDDKHNSRSMDWVPETLPPGAIVVISAVETGSCHLVLKRHEITPTEITVGVLDISDKAKIVRKKLAAHRKALDESPFNNQMKILMSKREAGNPLYLHLACEELRMFGVFEEVTDYLRKMPATIAMLLQEVLNRMEREHGVELLSSALAILCIVRNGLREEEMSGILSLLFSTKPHEARVPPIIISQLIRSLQSFLQPLGQEHTDTLLLAHKEIEKVVRLRYLRGAQADKERKLHKIIAQYFMESTDTDLDQSFKGNDIRAFTELPFHLMSAGDWKTLEETVCNLNFVLSKCQLGLATNLLEDYSPSPLNIPASKGKDLSRFVQLQKIKEFRSFVSRNLHVLLATPTLALQQAVNEPQSSLVSSGARRIVDESPYPMIYWVNKNNQEDPCKMTIPHHGDPVTIVTVSPDGSKIAAGFKSCIVRLYEITSGKEVHSYIGHAGAITGLCFVGDKGLCTSSNDTTLSLWSVKEGFRIAVMKGHKRSVSACTANKSGKSIVSVSLDMSIRVWKGDDGAFVSVLKTPGGGSQINCVAFHPEGQLIAVGCWDTTVKIWDTFNKKKLKVLKGHSTSVQSCAYISVSHIVSASMNGEVRIWSTRSGITVGVINGHSAPITSICTTPSGQHLITASNDKLVKVWSATLGTPIHNLGLQTNHGIGHCLHFDRNKQTITVGYHDGFISKFNVQSGVQMFAEKVHQSAVVSVHVLDELHFTSSHDRNIKVWTTSSLPFHMLLEGHRAPVTAAAWSPQAFASASDDLQIHIWPSGKAKYERDLKKKKTHAVVVKPIATLTGGHTGQISSIAFSNNGIHMVTGSHDKSFIVWDLLKKQMIKTIPSAHNDWINTCAFSSTNPELLITGSNDFNLKIWNTSDWSQKATLKGHTSAVTSVSWCEGFIISGSVDGSAKVWTKKGIEVTTLHAHQQRINATIMDTPTAAVTTRDQSAWADIMAGDDDDGDDNTVNNMYRQLDESLVISTSDDGSVAVWKPFIPQEITTLKGHSDRVLAVSSSFRNEVVSSSLDGSIRVWKPDLPDPNEVLRVGMAMGHVGPIMGTSLHEQNSQQGVLMGVTCGRDGCFVLWNISLDDNKDDGEQQPVTQLYKVKSSEKALTSVNIVAKSKIAVGNDLGEITTWKFTDSNYPKRDVQLKPSSLAGGAPVTSISLTNDNQYLIAASLNGQVLALSGANKRVTGIMDGHKDWVMGAVTCGSGKQTCVYSIGLDKALIEWKIAETISGKKGGSTSNAPVSQGTKYSIPLSIEGRREDPWPLAIVSVRDEYLVISDNTGRLLVWEKESKLFILVKKVHKDAITTMDVIDHNKIITGSADGILKIWELKRRVDVQLKQVGHFYCQSAITSVSAVKVDGDFITILVGDCNGYITVLKWK